MDKTRYLFKKTRDNKGKDGHNTEQKWMDLTEAEDIKKRYQEHTEELYKKTLMTQITMMV